MKKATLNILQAQHPLEVSPEQIRQWMDEAFAYIIPYLENMADIPMRDTSKAEALAQKLREPLPQSGETLDTLLRTIFHECVPQGVQVPSPGYMAYIPIGSICHSALAEFITFIINRWVALYDFAPGFVEIENAVLRWLCDIMGMPEGSGGILTSGGSMANFSAVVTARQENLGEDFSRGVIYFSEQTHHSVAKAARLAGFAAKQLRAVKTDDAYRICAQDLEQKITADKQADLTPFMLVANAGTTATGAIDDLHALAKICKKEKLWLHVDAAWAGSLRLTKNGKQMLAGTELADSITIDPHKALYTPFGAGALLVKNPRYLRAAHSFDADYLPDETVEDTLSPAHLSPELSRTARGLQLWLPLKMLGVQPFIETLEEKLQLIGWATEKLRQIESIEIAFEAQTVITGFRLVLPGKSQDELNDINRVMLARINAHGKILLSDVVLNGKRVIRIIPFGQRTHLQEVELALEYVKEAAEYCRKQYAK